MPGGFNQPIMHTTIKTLMHIVKWVDDHVCHLPW
jgi:hypothetical protein